MVALLILAVTLLWILLPLLPALLELRSRDNLKPLEVTDRSAGRVGFFARNFKQYLDKVLPQEAGTGDYAAKLLDGTEFIRVNRKTDHLATQQKTEPRLVILDAPQSLPGDQTYLMEVYSRAPLSSGPETNYRAVYSEDDLNLGEHNRVFRWAHANGAMNVGSHSVLRGRVSSELRLVMGSDVVFERAGAPVIAYRDVTEPPATTRSELKGWNLPVGAQKVGDHIRIEGDLDIPKDTLVSASLVVTGRLRIGSGALVEGSVKAHKDVELADKARVSGAVVTRSRLAMGEAAWIGGPALAERSVRLGRKAVVGGPTGQISVAGVEVELSEGATVYGQISAIRGARTT
jgi:cytoskeletal protein CcmA (bactofilin family)